MMYFILLIITNPYQKQLSRIRIFCQCPGVLPFFYLCDRALGILILFQFYKHCRIIGISERNKSNVCKAFS